MGVALLWAGTASAVTGSSDSPLFPLDTRTFQGQDSPLFTLDTRILSSVPDLVGTNRLIRCAPNPFNPATRIEFEIASPGPVSVAVYDVRGRLLQQILNRVPFEAGLHRVIWRGNMAGGQSAATGVYYVRCLMGETVDVRAVTLVK